MPRSQITPSAGMKSSPQFLKLILFCVWVTMVWVGICYLLIQIFRHFILSETNSNTATSVSCKTTKLLDAQLFTGGTPSYLPPHERPPDGLCLYLGCETQFEWHRWNHHQLKSSCQLVFVVWVARPMPALFILEWDMVSRLAGIGMTRFSIILLTGW